MGNVFDTPTMAAGYAKSRPAVHPYIIERTRKYLPVPLPVEGRGAFNHGLRRVNPQTLTGNQLQRPRG
jgi:hypothetical protein